MQPVPRLCASRALTGEAIDEEWRLTVESRLHLFSGRRAISAAFLACIV